MNRLAVYVIVAALYLAALWQWFPIHNVDGPLQLGPYPTAPGAKLVTTGEK